MITLTQLITYPARPKQGGWFPTALAAGAYEDLDAWCITDKYNGWRALVHVPTRTMFNRWGQRLTIAREFEPALRELEWCPLEWLDCEALERRHDVGKGTLIVLDWITEECADFEQRTDTLSEYFGGLPWELDQVKRDTVYRAPSYRFPTRAAATAHWENLQVQNATLTAPFYEGFVLKKANSMYPIQRHSAESECPNWVKHRFTTK